MARILILDDVMDILETMSFLLIAEGHGVRIETQAQDALRSLHATRYDLIITDALMPHMNGLEFLNALREHGILIPVIAMSGGATDSYNEHILGALRDTATYFLRKPIHPSSLCEAVTQALEGEKL